MQRLRCGTQADIQITAGLVVGLPNIISRGIETLTSMSHLPELIQEKTIEQKSPDDHGKLPQIQMQVRISEGSKCQSSGGRLR